MASLSLSLLPVDTNLAPIELQQKHLRRACVAFRLLSASLGMRKLLSFSPSSHSFGMRSGNQLKITGSLWLTIFSLRMCTRPQDLLRRRFPTFFLLLKNATFLESLTILNIFIIKNFELAFDQKSFTNYYLSERGKAVH
jgi:hypothetical protein